MRILSTFDVTPSLSSSSSSSLAVAEAPEQSPFHSPVPYLFGGLAAMLGLIAFALLILACSYWKISGFLGGGGRRGDQSNQNGEEKSLGDESLKVYEDKFLVIMAGDEIPTFLATPICIKASTFGEDLYCVSDQNKKDDEVETPKGEETSATAATGTESTDERDHHQTENRATHEETQNHQHQNH